MAMSSFSGLACLQEDISAQWSFNSVVFLQGGIGLPESLVSYCDQTKPKPKQLTQMDTSNDLLRANTFGNASPARVNQPHDVASLSTRLAHDCHLCT